MMNKKELAAVEDLKRQLREAKAMRFTEPVVADLPIPAYDDKTRSNMRSGFLFHCHISGNSFRVEPGCSNAVHHGFGYDHKTTSQDPRDIYSTRLLALRAMRREAERQCAGILAEIDRQIEQELAK